MLVGVTKMKKIKIHELLKHVLPYIGNRARIIISIYYILISILHIKKRIILSNFNFHLLLGEEPWIDQAFCTCINNSKETRGKKNREKSCFIANGKIKENGYSTCQEREKEDDISLPHKDSRVFIKLLSGKANLIKPVLRSNIGLFNVLVLEIPTIHKNADLQMHKNGWEKPEKIGAREADQEAQKHALISVKERPSGFLSLIENRLHFLGLPQVLFTYYFTTKLRKILNFFIFFKPLNFYSTGPPNRFSSFSLILK